VLGNKRLADLSPARKMHGYIMSRRPRSGRAPTSKNVPLCCQEEALTRARRGVTFFVAGPASDLSEELTVGVRSVALD
jgi:hypothetical protein